MKVTTVAFMLFLFQYIVAQKPVTVSKPEFKTAFDCKDAIPLFIAKSSHYGPTQSPVSYGNVQEITTVDKNSSISFTQEHNSAWYLLTMKMDGSLEFEILPVDTNDDYDFLFYPYKDSTFCDKILNKKLTPVRSNISNNSYHQNKGITGLSANATQAFHGQGVGDPMSLSVQVNKGDKYMLVLDNVTPEGKGHTIYFRYFKRVEIKGIVYNEENQPVISDVKLADTKGKTISQTTTDATGAYQIKTGVEENINYSLTFSNDSSFIGTRIINTATLNEGQSFPAIKTVLPKLKKGAKYPLGNINFYGGIATLLPTSIPSVEALLRLMNKNKKMIIHIEGHVNAPRQGNSITKESFSGEFQDLSEDRAVTVRDYLTGQGISKERITTIGLGASQMLYPTPKDELEASANRRVEIKVVSLNGE